MSNTSPLIEDLKNILYAQESQEILSRINEAIDSRLGNLISQGLYMMWRDSEIQENFRSGNFDRLTDNSDYFIQ